MIIQVAREIPDLKVIRSNRVGLNFLFFFSFFGLVGLKPKKKKEKNTKNSPALDKAIL
jgi:hypothetical protein